MEISLPSIVTLCSSITWRSADCVFGEVLLSSSASTILFITGPGTTSKSPVFVLYMDRPVISDGIVSGVHWILAKESASESESDFARVVFPTPGTSSISTCPPHKRAVISLSTVSLFPTIRFSIFCFKIPIISGLFMLSFFPLSVCDPKDTAKRWIPYDITRSEWFL